MQNFLKHSGCAELCQSGALVTYLSSYYVHVQVLMVFFFFFLTSWGLGLNCPLPVIIDNAFVVHCLISGHFAEVISAKTVKLNVSGVLSMLQSRTLVLLYLSCPDSVSSCWGVLTLAT